MNEIEQLRKENEGLRQALLEFADDVKGLCDDYSSRTGSVYVGDVKGCIDALLARYLPAAADRTPAADAEVQDADAPYQVIVDRRDLFDALRAAHREGQSIGQLEGAESWHKATDYADAEITGWKTMRQADRAAATSAGELEAVEGDLLPPIGSKVLIYLARQDAWVEHAVTGYYAWPALKHQVKDGEKNAHRVFVRVRHEDGYDNARLLSEVRAAAKGTDVQGGAA